jgi:phosphatidylserine synthase
MNAMVFQLWKTFKLFGFPIFSLWWRLFQKRDVRTKFDIYVFITITGLMPLLVIPWETNSFSAMTWFISGVRVTRSLVLCVCFVDRCSSFWVIIWYFTCFVTIICYWYSMLTIKKIMFKFPKFIWKVFKNSKNLIHLD